MPKDVREPFLREGDVWISRFDAARPLAEALRATLLEVHKQRQANAGRSEKMELLYNYICSPQFASTPEDRLRRLRRHARGARRRKGDDAHLEKREAQLTRMQDGLLCVVGDLQGIGQDAIPALDTLATLPGVDLVP